MQIRAIQTRFDGRRFRSRLEARWAVFFRELGIAYDYEPEGFVLGGMTYLPDFHILGRHWIEIKGQDPSPDERKKLVRLSVVFPDHWCWMFVGPPGNGRVWMSHGWRKGSETGWIFSGEERAISFDPPTHFGVMLPGYLEPHVDRARTAALSASFENF